MMKMPNWIILPVSVTLALACGGKGEQTVADVSASEAPVVVTVPAPIETPAKIAEESAPVAVEDAMSAGDVTASKIAASLESLTGDDIEAALRNGGWSTKGTTTSKSPENKPKKWMSIRVEARKGETTTEVLWFQGKDSWKRQLIEDEGGAYYQISEDVFIGVTIERNQKASKALLDSLVGT